MRTACRVIAALCGIYFGYIGALRGYHIAVGLLGAGTTLLDVAGCFFGVVMLSLSVLTLRVLRNRSSCAMSALQLLFVQTLGPLFAGLIGSATLLALAADGIETIGKWPAFLSDRGHAGRVTCYVLVALLSLCLSLRAIWKANSLSSERRPLFRQSAYGVFLALFVLPFALRMFVDIAIYSDLDMDGVPLSNVSAVDWKWLGMQMDHVVVGIVFIVLAFSAVLRSRDSGGELGQRGLVAEVPSSQPGSETPSRPERPGIEQSQAPISPTAAQT